VEASGEYVGVTDREPTQLEREFFEALARQVPGVQDWYHSDPDGRLWMIVSYDVVGERGMEVTWRVDYDAGGLVGGRSPAFLNWDGGVRADAAEVDADGPGGIRVVAASPQAAADIAAAWFRQRIG
jgi:hypothetical protein